MSERIKMLHPDGRSEAVVHRDQVEDCLREGYTHIAEGSVRSGAKKAGAKKAGANDKGEG